MNFILNDGGRAAAGYRGQTGDCVARSICIAAGLPYTEVYDRLTVGCQSERMSKHNNRIGGRTARHGVFPNRKWFKTYMAELGFTWTPTMMIGSGCKVHLKDGELPMGRLVVAVSKHYTAVIDGIIHDNHDPSRNGNRCVYGYWMKVLNYADTSC